MKVQTFLKITLLFFIGINLQAQPLEVKIPKPYPLEDYNFVIGTQAIGCKYKFTEAPYLIEQARQIRSMGSNILKISLGRRYLKSYNIQKDPSIRTTLALIQKKKQFKQVLDMNFKYIFARVHTLTDVNWGKGLNKNQKQILYQEMYELTEFLLKEYSGTGKIFMLGNWKGDWLLNKGEKPNTKFSDERVQNMVDWFTIRQRAIDDAKKNTLHEKVAVFHYVEVNLVNKALAGKRCVTNLVLPKVNVDLVAYTIQEVTESKKSPEQLKKDLQKNIDYLESKLQAKEGIPFDRRVFISEYAFTIRLNTEQAQSDRSKAVMMTALGLNLPFALYWQLYNSEYPQHETKGHSLISEAGYKKPVYHLHANFYKKMNNWLKIYKAGMGKYPSREEFREKGLEVLEGFEFEKSKF